ncbi:helix-turn-helix domain-containing protein [Clostridium sp. MD294]|nr:helix-turn-helix domain-containing protein [Clostridium sp. MD294]NDO47076.1 helix-turn-helix domain-containing protein [Clostridium sp. MD294]
MKPHSGFISLLSTRTMYDEQGKPVVYIDEELRRRLETKLIAKIPTFKVA